MPVVFFIKLTEGGAPSSEAEILGYTSGRKEAEHPLLSAS